MRTPPIDRLHACVARQQSDRPLDYEYVLWYEIPAFPVWVKVHAYPPMPSR